MFGEVPIIVIVPPSSEPKAIGIRKYEGEIFVRRASWKATGISMASAPIFFTKPAISVTEPTRSRITLRGESRKGASFCSAASTMPERATDALTTSAEPTMMTISSLKPLNASSGGTMPTTTEVKSASIATTS